MTPLPLYHLFVCTKYRMTAYWHGSLAYGATHSSQEEKRNSRHNTDGCGVGGEEGLETGAPEWRGSVLQLYVVVYPPRQRESFSIHRGSHTSRKITFIFCHCWRMPQETFTALYIKNVHLSLDALRNRVITLSVQLTFCWWDDDSTQSVSWV